MTLNYVGKQTQGKLQPEIKKYLHDSRAEMSKFPTLVDINLQQFRENLSTSRLGFNHGGPEMAQIIDHQISIETGNIAIRCYYPTMFGKNTQMDCIFYLHGGGWVFHNLDTHDRMMREIAARTGMAVIGIDYHLAPEYKYPYQINQIYQLLEYCFNKPQQFNINVNNIMLMGDSAGANLVLATMQMLHANQLDSMIKALVLIYGVYDCATFAPSYELYSGGKLSLDKEEMQWFINHYLDNKTQIYNPDVSPIYAQLDYLPPTLMPIAEYDILHDENIDMYDHLIEQGVEAEANIYYGTMHGFIGAINNGGIVTTMLEDITKWIKNRHIKMAD